MSEKVFFVLGVSDIFGTFVRKLKDVYEKNGLLYRVFVVVVDGGGAGVEPSDGDQDSVGVFKEE
ncbi:MAG: hypothetical protein RR397_04445 [Odoribacter sp.]